MVIYRLHTANPWIVGSVSHFAGLLFMLFTAVFAFAEVEELTDWIAEVNIILDGDIISLSGPPAPNHSPLHIAEIALHNVRDDR